MQERTKAYDTQDTAEIGLGLEDIEDKGKRPVAQFGRASVSKTEGWGFDSLLAWYLQVRFGYAKDKSKIGYKQRDFRNL